jgi:hypothetical protein
VDFGVGVEKCFVKRRWESFFVIIAISIMRRLVAWSQMVAPSLEVILFTCSSISSLLPFLSISSLIFFKEKGSLETTTARFHDVKLRAGQASITAESECPHVGAYRIAQSDTTAYPHRRGEMDLPRAV